jgi:FeS assembly protein SufD
MSMTKTNIYASALTHYLHEYARLAKHSQDSTLLKKLRQTASERFAILGFPSSKQPAWQYTPLISFLQTPFLCALAPSVNESLIAEVFAESPSTHRLVFVNGIFSQDLSQKNPLAQGIIINHLADVNINNAPAVVNRLAANLHTEENSFIHLNTACMRDGAYIYLPPNTELATPLEFVFITTAEQQFIPIRNIIIAEKNTRAVILEKYISLHKTTQYFTNVVTECFLSPQSHIEHYKYIEESTRATHMGSICVKQQAKSQFAAYVLAVQGGLTRNDTQIQLGEPDAQCQLKGLYSVQEKQYSEHQTTVEHLSEQTRSEEFYKGIIADKGRAVFNGKLIIKTKAIKSKATQLNKNLLLSPSAEVYTKPQLEIFIDDVQCTHGASIGQLDETSLFYLRARGLSAMAARKILIGAFMQEILQQMPLFNSPVFLNSLKKVVTFDDAGI